jgi:copper(I)-binding protein
VSRTVQHPIRTRRRLVTVAPVVAGLGLALLLSGCGAGQITQTDTQAAAVNGASGEVGAMAVRGVELAYPDNSSQGVYPPGSNADLIVTIVNTGVAADTLTGVSTPAAVSVTIDGSPTGAKDIPGGFAVVSGADVDDRNTTATTAPLTSSAPATTPGVSSSTTPTTAATTTTPNATPPAAGMAPSKVSIVLTGIKSVNGAALRSGLTIPITFTFARAGQVTVDVPIAAPADNSSAGNTGS